MRRCLKMSMVLMVLVLLVGCGGAQSTATPQPTATPTATPAPTPDANAPYPGDAASVVEAFLSTLVADPSGQSSRRFLDAELQDAFAQGRPITAILGVPDLPVSFSLGPSINETNTAQVQAILVGSSTTPALFVLTQAADGWHISIVLAGQ